LKLPLHHALTTSQASSLLVSYKMAMRTGPNSVLPYMMAMAVRRRLKTGFPKTQKAAETLRPLGVNLDTQYSPSQPEMSAFGLLDGEAMPLESASEISNTAMMSRSTGPSGSSAPNINDN
jgi:hypothetical protein